MLKCGIQGNQFLLNNYYAPNIEIDQTKVFWEMVHNIEKLNQDNECKIFGVEILIYDSKYLTQTEGIININMQVYPF